MSTLNKRYIFWCVLFAVPMQGAGIDIFAPALPQVIAHFESHHVALAIGFYLIGYGVGQFFIGPLTDSYGRKKILVAGFIIYILASVLSGLANSTTMLLIMRLIQGAAIAAPAVVNRAIFTDIYEKDELPLMMNWFTTAWALGPVVAPFIGGYLTDYLDWRYTLFFMAAYAVVMVIAFSRVPETHPQRHPLNIKHTASAFGEMLRSAPFLGAIIAVGAMYAVIIVFNVLGPILLQKRLGLSPVDFGYIALVMGLAIFLGNVANGHMMKRMSQHLIVSTNYIIAVIAALFMFLMATMNIFNTWAIVVPTFILFLNCGITFGNLYGVPMKCFKHHGGKAGGLMGSMFLIMAGIMGAFAAFIPNQNQVGLALANLIMVIMAMLFYWFMVKRVFQKNNH